VLGAGGCHTVFSRERTFCRNWEELGPAWAPKAAWAAYLSNLAAAAENLW
jgi:hypothetical protein